MVRILVGLIFVMTRTITSFSSAIEQYFMVSLTLIYVQNEFSMFIMLMLNTGYICPAGIKTSRVTNSFFLQILRVRKHLVYLFSVIYCKILFENLI